MEDRDFFDTLYNIWTNTTGAEDSFWMPEEDEGFPGRFNIWAVPQSGTRKPVASFVTDEDADFITAVHGCLPDLIRRLIDALDEADRLDHRVDDQTGWIADLCQEIDEKDAKICRLTDDYVEKDLKVIELLEQLELQREEVEFWRSHK